MTDEQSDQQLAREARREKRRRASLRRVRWWLRALVVVVLVVFACYTAWVAILTPQRVADFVSKQLADSTQARVRVGAARVAFPGVLYIDNLEMRLPDMDSQLGRLVEVDQATLSLDLTALLRGEVQADKLTLSGPVVYVTELPEVQLYHYQLLPPGDQLVEDELGPGIKNVPEIHIHGGRLQFGTIRDGKYEIGEQLAVTGRMLHDMRRPGWFAFVLRQQLQGGAAGPTLSGHLDTATGAFDAQLDQMSIDSPQRNLIPERFRQWWDRLSPSGSFPHASVTYEPDNATPWSAEIVVDGVDLTLPVGEKPIALEMESGSVRFVDNAVHIDRFVGVIDQVRYEIDGRYEGISVDAPFRVQTKLKGNWPNDPETLAAIPPKIRRHIDRFSPEGEFEGVVAARRDVADGDLDVNGSISLLNVSMLYEKFPYPMDTGTGEITFTEDQINLIGLKGIGSGGAIMACDGVINNAGPAAEVNLTITGKGVPVDDALLGAMKENVRDLTRMFFDETTNQQIGKLVELGEVGGKADVHVDVIRPAGIGQPTRAIVKATPATPLLVSFKHWPYPLVIESGNLHIEPKKFVRIENFKITGPTGVVGEVNGELLPHEKTGKLVPDIQFEIDKLPVDDVLLATIPESHAKHLRDLKISGRLAAIGTVFHSDATGRIEFDVRAHLVNGKAAPFGGSRTLERLEAEMQVRQHEFVLDSARTWHGGGEYLLDGKLQWATPPVAGAPGSDQPQGEVEKEKSLIVLNAKGKNIVIDQTLLDLVPPDTKHTADLRKILDEKNVAGVADINVTYRGHGDDATFDLTALPQSLAFDQRNARVNIGDMSGSLVVEAEKVRLEKIGGKFGDEQQGRFDVTGEATFDEGFRLNAVANVEAEVANKAGRVMLPANIVDAIDRLKIAGSYKLTNVHLYHHPSAKSGDKLQIGAIVSFDNIEAKIGSADVQRLDGEAQVALRQPAGAKHPLVDSLIELHRMGLSGRPVRDVELRLVSDANDSSRLLLRDLTGIAAGGDLSGQGWFGLEKAAAFNLQLAMADAQLEQLVRRRKVQESKDSTTSDQQPAHEADDTDEQPVTGLVSANLKLAGRIGDPDAARGSGFVKVHKAQLYELPMVLGMLQLINLALPVSSSFDEASVAFQIRGEEAALDKITFDARGVQIVGSGTMNYRSQQVDIMLRTRNVDAPDIWPISDLFNAVKDGLIKVHITGTLSDPKTRLVGLGGTRGEAQADARNTPE